MTFAQRRNRLTTHFSELIHVVKRRISVYYHVQCYSCCLPRTWHCCVQVTGSAYYRFTVSPLTGLAVITWLSMLHHDPSSSLTISVDILVYVVMKYCHQTSVFFELSINQFMVRFVQLPRPEWRETACHNLNATSTVVSITHRHNPPWRDSTSSPSPLALTARQAACNYTALNVLPH